MHTDTVFIVFGMNICGHKFCGAVEGGGESRMFQMSV